MNSRLNRVICSGLGAGMLLTGTAGVCCVALAGVSPLVVLPVATAVEVPLGALLHHKKTTPHSTEKRTED